MVWACLEICSEMFLSPQALEVLCSTPLKMLNIKVNIEVVFMQFCNGSSAEIFKIFYLF